MKIVQYINQLKSSDKIILSILFIIIIAAIFLLFRKYRRYFSIRENFIKLLKYIKPKKNIYKKNYSKYKKNIPWKISHTLHTKKQFIYFNSAEDDLIYKCTDVKKYNYTYNPNYRANNSYNFYFNGKSLISEIKNDIIINNEQDELRQLQQFWKKLFKHQKPEVLISIDYNEITNTDRNDFNEIGMAVKKKIDTLISAVGCSFPIYLCICGLNKREGYSELLQYFRTIKLNYIFIGDTHKKLEEKLKSGIDIAYNNLNYMLKENKTSYISLNAMECIFELEKISTCVSNWFKTFTFNDGIVKPIQFDGIILNSYNKIQNPFRSLYSKPELSYRKRNILISFLFILATTIIVITAINIKQIKRPETSEFLKEFKENNNISFNDSTEKISAFIEKIEQKKKRFRESLFNRMFPIEAIFNSEKQKISEIIYKNVLLPNLNLTVNPEKVIFLISFIKSTQNYRLRNYVLKNIDKWSAECEIDKNILLYYLYNNNRENLKYLSGNAALAKKKSFKNFKSQNNYILELYSTICSSNNITIEDINHFLNYYYKFYNKKITISILIDKYSPELKNNLPNEAVAFVEKYEEYMKQSITNNYPSTDTLDIIDTSYEKKYSVPKDIKSVTELIYALDVISSDAYPSKKEKDLIITTPDGEFQKRNWKQTVTLAKINTILKNFYANDDFVKELFSEEEKELYMPVYTYNKDDENSFMKIGKKSIPGIYSKLTVNSILMPTMLKYKELLNKLETIGIKTSLLKFNINRSIDKYVEYYINEYKDLIDSFTCDVDSPQQLNLFLNYVMSPESQIIKLIEIVKENTDFVISDKGSFLKPIKNEFKSYASILKTKKGENTELELYFDIISQISDELEEKKKLKTDTAITKNEFASLKKKLSILGRISFDIAMDNKKSYLNQVNTFLDNTRMPKELRSPLIKPVIVVYDFCKKDMSCQLEKIWESNMHPKINYVNKLFPFNDNAEKNVSPKKITESFSPEGTFWTDFNNYFKPFLIKKGKEWTVKEIQYSKPLISQKKLDTINKIEYLTSLFWDKDSNPIPLEYSVQAMDLNTKGLDKNAMVLMSYFNTEDQVIYGINSAPIWKQVSVKWWQKNISDVGIQMSDGTNFSKGEKQEYFSFFRLLKSGINKTKNELFSWNVNIIGKHKKIVKVDYLIKPNPWKEFKI